MNVSAKTEYACIAVLELAARYDSDRPVRIREIAEAHDIPSQFLVQILLQLKAAGVISSTRGAAGGYQLAKPPRDITLADVMAVMEGAPPALRSEVLHPSAASRVLDEAWREVSAVEHEMLSNVTFAELTERARGAAEAMYYI